MSSRVRVVTPELLDSAVANLVNTSGTAANGAVRTVGAGGGTVQTTGVIAATPNTLVQRDGAGRTQFATPSVSADVATKGYVDTQDNLLVPKTQLGAASGVATLDSNGLVTTAQVPSWVARQFGSGTAFPTTNNRQGDVVLRTDIGLNGSLWVYTGVTGLGSNGWITEGPVLVSATDTAVGLYDGQYRDVVGSGLQRWSSSLSTWVSPGVGLDAPVFRGRRVQAQACLNNANTIIALDTVEVDPTGMLNAADGSVIIKRSGYYISSASFLTYDSVNGVYQLTLTKNGSAYNAGFSDYHTNASAQVGVQMTARVLAMSAGDKIQMNLYQNTGFTIHASSGSGSSSNAWETTGMDLAWIRPL